MVSVCDLCIDLKPDWNFSRGQGVVPRSPAGAGVSAGDLEGGERPVRSQHRPEHRAWACCPAAPGLGPEDALPGCLESHADVALTTHSAFSACCLGLMDTAPSSAVLGLRK